MSPGSQKVKSSHSISNIWFLSNGQEKNWGKNEFERMFHIVIESKVREVITIPTFTHQSLRVCDETEIREIIIWWAWPI